MGDSLKAWRLLKGYRTKKLHERSGVLRGVISQIESGKIRLPSVVIVRALAESLGIPIGILITRRRPEDVFPDRIDLPMVTNFDELDFPSIPVNLNRPFGDALKLWRKYLGVTQSHLVISANSAISQYENGKLKQEQPSDRVIVKLTQALGIPRGALVTRTLPEELLIK